MSSRGGICQSVINACCLQHLIVDLYVRVECANGKVLWKSCLYRNITPQCGPLEYNSQEMEAQLKSIKISCTTFRASNCCIPMVL